MGSQESARWRWSFSAALTLNLSLSVAACGGTGSSAGSKATDTASSNDGDATADGTTDGMTGTGGTTSSATASGTTTWSAASSGGLGSVTSTTGAAFAPACPGTEPRADVPGQTCRSPEDCESGATCSPEPFSGCGFCTLAQRDCEDDDQCGEGQHCVEFESPETCLCVYELASECRPACTDTSCGAGYECIDETCLPQSCNNGFECAEGWVCAAERGTADAHGCAPPNCNEGHPCEAGTACDTDTGECRVVHCSEEGAAACPLNTECDPEAFGRGCVPKACDADADCDCGVCIHICSGPSCPPGQCADRLYVCQHPVP